MIRTSASRNFLIFILSITLPLSPQFLHLFCISFRLCFNTDRQVHYKEISKGSRCPAEASFTFASFQAIKGVDIEPLCINHAPNLKIPLSKPRLGGWHLFQTSIDANHLQFFWQSRSYRWNQNPSSDLIISESSGFCLVCHKTELSEAFHNFQTICLISYHFTKGPKILTGASWGCPYQTACVERIITDSTSWHSTPCI